MALTFEYEKNHSTILGEIRRPVARVSFYSQPKDKWYDILMIVDTGADYTLLPKYFADQLGINLKKECKVFKTSGVGGTRKVFFLERVKVTLGPWERVIPIGFLDQDTIPPLLGRHLFLETFKIVFSPDHTVTFSSK